MSVLPSGPIARVVGAGLPLGGDDIDTDRIMPARFLRAVSFEGLEAHVFEDDRTAAREARARHPFDDVRFANASVLIVNRNFGCGSSREHAPQGLVRWGVRAIVGESYSEIFFGNAAVLGLPCVAVSPADARALQAFADAQPAALMEVDLAARQVRAGELSVPLTIAEATREAFLTGTWDPTALLLDRYEQVQAVASRLPYMRGF